MSRSVWATNWPCR